MKNKKVILLDGSVAQGKPRGMGIYTLNLVLALSKAIDDYPIQIQVALNSKKGSDPWPELNQIVKKWGEASNVITWEQIILPRLAIKNNANLIHYMANTATWFSKVPYIVTIHDTIFIRSFLKGVNNFCSLKDYLAHIYYCYGVGIGARRAKHILTDSKSSSEDLINRLKLSNNKISVIPLAVPHPVTLLSEEEVKQILSANNITSPYIVALGAIDGRKNILNLVKSFAKLSNGNLEITLVLLGFEKYSESKIPKVLKKLGLYKRVKILNYLSEKEFIAIFQGAECLVYPTRQEGFGLPILQAFYLGVPVITTKISVISEVAGSAARFIDPDDITMLANTMKQVLIDLNIRRELIKAGKKQLEKFSWNKTASQTLAIYKRILADH